MLLCLISFNFADDTQSRKLIDWQQPRALVTQSRSPTTNFSTDDDQGDVLDPVVRRFYCRESVDEREGVARRNLSADVRGRRSCRESTSGRIMTNPR